MIRCSITRFLVIFFLSTFLLHGCSGTKKHSNKTLRLNLSIFPTTFDPRKAQSTDSAIIAANTYEGLTRPAKDGSYEPALAKEIHISPDRLVYTFTLRESYWSDGSKLTAHDFEKTIKKSLSPNFPSKGIHHLYPIKNAKQAKKGEVDIHSVGIYALDENTLVIELDHPTPYFLELTSLFIFSPVHASMPDDVFNGKSMPISNGPFILDWFVFGSELVLKKNPFYWEKEKVKLDEVYFSIIDSELTTLHLFQQGEIDFIGTPFSPIPRDALDDLVKENKIESYPVASLTTLEFNTTRFPFSNSLFRKAFSTAINRKNIVQHVTKLDDIPATSIIPKVLQKPPLNMSYIQDGDAEAANYYLELALKEIGIEKHELEPIPFMYSSSELASRLVQAIADQIEKTLGLKMNLECVEQKSYFEHLNQSNFAVTHAAYLLAYTDPMAVLSKVADSSLASNFSKWQNPLYQNILNQSNYASSVSERMNLLKQAEDIFMDEMPQCPLFYWSFSYMLNPRIKNLYFSPIGMAYLKDVDIVEETEITQSTTPS